jgi:hypothetical protein
MRAAQKTNAGLRKHPALMRDLSTIAFCRAVALLRRLEPVPGILAARRPGAIMDKSERRFGANTKSCRPCHAPTGKTNPNL